MGSTSSCFVCGLCNRKTLVIKSSVNLGADNRSDDRLLQIISCGNCDFKGFAIYEESRRGNFYSESYNHTAYQVSNELFNEIKSAIETEDIIDFHKIVQKAIKSFTMRF